MLELLRVDEPGQNNQPFNPAGLFEFAKKASELFFSLKKRCTGVGNVFSAGQPESDVEVKKPFFKDKQRRRLVLAYFSDGEFEGKRPEGGTSGPEQEPFNASGNIPKKCARYRIKRDENSGEKNNSQDLDGHRRQFFNPCYPFFGCLFFVFAYGFYHLASPVKNIFYAPSLTESDAKLFLYTTIFYVLAGVHVFLSAWEHLWCALVANGVYPATACAVLLGVTLVYAMTDPLYLIPFWIGVFLFAAYVFNKLFFIFVP